MNESSDSKIVLYCPHCGNTSVQTALLSQEFVATFYAVPSGEASEEPSTYNVVRCETCAHLLVYSEHHGYSEYSDTPFGDLRYPKPSSFSDAVPESIQRYYKEAVRVKNISPTAYVVLARRVLEEICTERGVAARSLADALTRLAADNVIPRTLSEATTLIRLVGNAGAHAGQEINMLQVWAIDDFIKAVIEYIYVAPAKIEEFKKRFERFAG